MRPNLNDLITLLLAANISEWHISCDAISPPGQRETYGGKIINYSYTIEVYDDFLQIGICLHCEDLETGAMNAYEIINSKWQRVYRQKENWGCEYI